MQLHQIKDYTVANRESDKFEKLLKWLDKDRDRAGRKYRSIHLRLTKIFYARGSHLAEELADETIERVTNKIDFLTDNYVGEPALYFYGVAKKVFLEFTRKPIDKELPISLSQKESSGDLPEHLDECLTKCLKTLSLEQSEFIIEYYRKDKQDKIKHRKQMAEELGITMRALRVRAFRIRKHLQKDLSKKLENTVAASTDNRYGKSVRLRQIQSFV